MKFRKYDEYDHTKLSEDMAIILRPNETDKSIREKVLNYIYKFLDENGNGSEEYQNDAPENLHQYIDPDLIGECKQFVNSELQDELYNWAVTCCERRLGFESEFYVDEEIFVRINPPFDYGMKGTKPTEKKPETPINRLKTHLKSKLPGLSAPKPSKKALEYNRNRPTPTHSHGPHIDTWYGHSFTATNLWFSVCGVNTSSSMVIYPDKYRKEVPYDPEFMYVSKEVDRRNPVELELEDGENFVFNPELLHSTRLNTSSGTRIVITLRVSEDEPLFSNETTHEHTHDKWVSSSDIKNSSIQAKNVGQYVDPPGQEPVDIEEKIRIELDESLRDLREAESLSNERISDIEDNHPFEIILDGNEFIGVKTNGTLYVGTSTCPHAGFPFERGSVKDSKIKCPEHGAEFDLETGSCAGSECSSLKISTIRIGLAD